jgi:hypothetical protein
MKKQLISVLLYAFVLSACGGSRKSPHETVQGENIKVTYGRPYKKGREIFGKLVAYGHVWRTGADEATAITFAKDVLFANAPVKAGSYTLYTIPTKSDWTIILNGQTGQWGTVYNKDKDVVRVQASSETINEPIEQLTIRFQNNNMLIEWDRTRVTVPIAFPSLQKLSTITNRYGTSQPANNLKH